MVRSHIAFYFDFSSPYGYFASARIDDIAARHGRAVEWHPILLGAVFRITNQAPLAAIPLKGDYSLHDWKRCARLLQLPFQAPDPFPIAAAAPARLFYWARREHPDHAVPLAKALFTAYFGENRDISGPAVCATVADKCGLSPDAAISAMQATAGREHLRGAIDAAVGRGVFGSPYFIVDGEPFWGADRIDQLDRWLTTGGW